VRTRTHNGTDYELSDPHPAADAFPWLPEDELQQLADDIAANGQQYKIVRLPDGRVIDGRNRELACRVAGVEPEYRDEEMGEDEVISFVMSANVHRRQLTASQRAMAAAELANLRPGDNQHTGEVAPRGATSQSDVADQMDVSRRSVQRAAKVKSEAPELVGAVKDGKLDVDTAAKAAKLPKRTRKKIAKAADPKKAAKEELAKQEETPETPETPADEGAEFVKAVETLCREMDQVAARMKALKSSRFAYSINIDSSVSQVQAARQTFWQGRPAHPCPYCSAEGCKACAMTGRVKKATHDSGREAMGVAS
jgi:ParB-like chromosome segregation protein Spo0J